MGLSNIARRGIKSVGAYGLKLLGENNGNLKKGNLFVVHKLRSNYLLYSTK